MDCAHCGCDVEAHDPVTVIGGVDEGTRRYFCNHACLHVWIEETDRLTGTSCRWSAAEQ